MTEQSAPVVHEPTFSEAPASWNVRYVLDGFECQLTLRSNTGAELMPNTIKAIDWLVNHNAHPTGQKSTNNAPAPSAPAPSAPAPAPTPASPTPEETIQVSSIAHAVTDTGHHFIKVKGGKFSKYGVKAWAESLPPTTAGWESWPIGQEYAPMDGMEYAIVCQNKVVRFASTI